MRMTIGELIDLLMEFHHTDTVDMDTTQLILMVKNKDGKPVGWIEPHPGIPTGKAA